MPSIDADLARLTARHLSMAVDAIGYETSIRTFPGYPADHGETMLARVLGEERPVLACAMHMRAMMKHFGCHIIGKGLEFALKKKTKTQYELRIDEVPRILPGCSVRGSKIPSLDLGEFKHTVFVPRSTPAAIEALLPIFGPSYYISEEANWCYNLFHPYQAYLHFRDEETAVYARLLFGQA